MRLEGAGVQGQGRLKRKLDLGGTVVGRVSLTVPAGTQWRTAVQARPWLPSGEGELDL